MGRPTAPGTPSTPTPSAFRSTTSPTSCQYPSCNCNGRRSNHSPLFISTLPRMHSFMPARSSRSSGSLVRVLQTGKVGSVRKKRQMHRMVRRPIPRISGPAADSKEWSPPRDSTCSAHGSFCPCYNGTNHPCSRFNSDFKTSRICYCFNTI